jgi:hypothetical protein
VPNSTFIGHYIGQNGHISANSEADADEFYRAGESLLRKVEAFGLLATRHPELEGSRTIFKDKVAISHAGSEVPPGETLRGKRVAVAGGSRGLGRVIVEAVHAEGARVLAVARAGFPLIGPTRFPQLGTTTPPTPPTLAEFSRDVLVPAVQRSL